MIPKKVTVLVDSRENFPVLFPSTVEVVDPSSPKTTKRVKVDTEVKAMEAGDYCLKEFPNGVGVERKASQAELIKNLTDPKDKARQGRAFDKFVKTYKWAYLLVEASPRELMAPNARMRGTQEIVSRLTRVSFRYRFHLLVIPWKSRSAEARRHMGTFLVHLMLAPILEDNKNGR